MEGKVPAAQLPSYVDDVIEFDALADFPETGERGKIYVALDTNLTYRWSGSAYVEISPSPDLTPYAKKTDVTKAVNAEKTRAVAAENLKADKTTVSALSTAVENRRTNVDLAVYERTIYSNVASVDPSTGSEEQLTSILCYLKESDYSSTEIYQGTDGTSSLEVVFATSGGEMVSVRNIGYTDAEGVTSYSQSASFSNDYFEGITDSPTYRITGYVNSPSARPGRTLATTYDVAEQATATLASAKAAVRAEALFSIATVAAGATLAYSTISRFTPSDETDTTFALADPPAGRMAEYELWVDCKTAAPASVAFKLANAAKTLDVRVEGTVAAMETGKTYVYRVQAFENPDANHVTLVASQTVATLADYSADQLYAPNTAFEIDTTNGEGLTFALHAYRKSGYVTVYWGDGTYTRKYTASIPASFNDEANFSHTYSAPGTYIIQIADSAMFSLTGSPMVVRALRWGDTVTNASLSYTNCTNLTGTVPPWGAAITTTGTTNYIVDSTLNGAFGNCSKLTGAIPAWPERMSSCGTTYAGCSGLTGSIPPWPETTARFGSCYYGCSGLTGSIPPWPTYHTGSATSNGQNALSYAYGLFHGCSGLTGSIPPWPTTDGVRMVLFNIGRKTSTHVFCGCFCDCTGLTGKIPAWPTNVVNIMADIAFRGCTGLTGIWDENAADAEIMPSNAKFHSDCVTGASEAVRKHFTADWGGTKEAATETTEEST